MRDADAEKGGERGRGPGRQGARTSCEVELEVDVDEDELRLTSTMDELKAEVVEGRRREDLLEI